MSRCDKLNEHCYSIPTMETQEKGEWIMSEVWNQSADEEPCSLLPLSPEALGLHESYAMQDVTFDPVKHQYFDAQGNHKPSVTWILAQSGLCDFSFVEQEIRDRAMARGRSVHWMLQLDDQKACPNTVARRLRPFRRAYREWKRFSGFVPESIEWAFVSPYGYAGTLDRSGMFPRTVAYPFGSRAVVDFKTGNSPVQDWVRYQLVAYAMAMHRNSAVARTYRRIGLALHPDGTYQVKEFYPSSWDTDWAIFIEAMRRTNGSQRTGD